MEREEPPPWSVKSPLLKGPQNGNNPGPRSGVVYSSGCAGGIRGRCYGPEVVLEVRLA